MGGVRTVEFGCRISRSSSRKGHWKIGCSHSIIEDARPVGSVVIKGLIHDVPGIAFSLVVAHLAGDVSLDGSGKGAVGPCTRGYPGW